MIAKKRLLPILVAVLMVFAMIPMTAGKVFADDTLCVSVVPNSVTYNSTRTSREALKANVSGGSGEYSYQWYSSGGPDGYKDIINGAVTASYVPKAEAGDFYYSVKVTDSNNQSVTSDPVKVRIAPTKPEKSEIKITSVSTNSVSIQLDSSFDLGESWGVQIVKANESPTEPGLNRLLWAFKLISDNSGRYGSEIYVGELEPGTTYNIYASTYVYYYNAYNPTYSDLTGPITFKTQSVKTVKKANPLTIKPKTATVKYSKLKKKTQTLAVTKVIKFTKKGQGTMTYTKASGNKKITINKKTGKITVKKGLKKGTYKVKVKVKAAGNSNYKAVTKTVTFKVKVK